MVVSVLADVLDEIAPDLKVTPTGDDLVVEHDRESARRRILHRSTLTPPVAGRIVNEGEPGLVIAEVIDSAAEGILRRSDWSYWDRRGRLRLWLPEIGVRIDVPTPSYSKGTDRSDPRRPVVGTGGISLAVGLLQSPADPPGVREIARMADMAPSTISRARKHLTQAALIDSDGTPVVPELFWATGDAWVVDTVPVGVEPEGEGWVLGGDAAAAHFGAPVFASSRRFYCADRASFDRHRVRHRTPEAEIQIAIAPTPLVVTSAINGLVHPAIAALDLSSSARGREILGDWNSIEPSVPGAEVVWQ